MLPPIATVDEFAIWAGDVDNPERAEAILAAASTLVRSTTGRTWVDADEEPEEGLTDLQLDAAKTVVIQVALRVYNNPNGITSETTGPFSKTVAAWAAYGLELTDVEKQLLGTSDSVPGLTSVRLIAPALARGSRMFDPCWWEEQEDEGS